MRTTKTKEYETRRLSEERERAERKMRIARFVATNDEDIVADLFAEVKAALIDKEADEVFYLTKYYKVLTATLDEVESEFCSAYV